MMDLTKTNFRSILPKPYSTSAYRAANPDSWSNDDLNTIIRDYHIKTIIDLRHPSHLPSCPQSGKANDLQQLFHHKIHYSVVVPPRYDPSNGVRTRYVIPFITAWFYPSVIRQLSWYQIIILIYYLFEHLFTGSKMYEIYVARNSLAKIDLAGLYCNMMDGAKYHLKSIFRILSHPCQYPVLICCQQGKDRTGIVSMLLQDLMGCDLNFMEENYSLTEEQCGPAESAIFSKYNLPESYSKSEKSTLTKCHQYLREKYGGAEGLLKTIGITEEEIAAIRRNLMSGY